MKIELTFADERLAQGAYSITYNESSVLDLIDNIMGVMCDRHISAADYVGCVMESEE